MNHLARYASIIILFLFQLSCSNLLTVERKSLEQQLFEMDLIQGDTVSRLSSYRINGWRSIDDYNLIITIGVNDDYLVTLRTRCFDLQNAFFIGFTTTAGSLDQFESIVVEGPGPSREFCQIREIFEVNDIIPATG